MPFMYGNRWGINEGWAGQRRPWPAPQGPGRPLHRHRQRHRRLPHRRWASPRRTPPSPPATASSTATTTSTSAAARGPPTAAPPPPRSAARGAGPRSSTDARRRPPARPADHAGLRHADRPRARQGLAVLRRQRLGRRHLAARHRGLPPRRRGGHGRLAVLLRRRRARGPRAGRRDGVRHPRRPLPLAPAAVRPLPPARRRQGSRPCAAASSRSASCRPTRSTSRSTTPRWRRTRPVWTRPAASAARCGSARPSRSAGATPTTRARAARRSTSPTLPNGTYFVAVEANPTGELFETDNDQQRLLPQGDPQGAAGQALGLRPGRVRHRRPRAARAR